MLTIESLTESVLMRFDKFWPLPPSSFTWNFADVRRCSHRAKHRKRIPPLIHFVSQESAATEQDSNEELVELEIVSDEQ